jgi:hypothetical protein
MRTPFAWIAAAIILIFTASPLLATPTSCYDCDKLVTWTDVYDPADVYLNKCGPTRTLTIPFNIADDGFQPGVDKIYRYRIEVGLYDDDDGFGGAGWFEIPGHNQFDLFTLKSDPLILTSNYLKLAFLKDDGKMNLILHMMCGDFYFDYAKISALGCDYGPAPVPEPATLFLLGSGLVGMAGYGRKKFKKA